MRRARPLILNIDDDTAGRYAVSRSLKQAGFDVVEAATGMEGLSAAEVRNPDLILLDIRLPDIDGFQVCRRLRAQPEMAGTPVLQMSASYLDVSSHVKGLEDGADAYLTEPVEPQILIATINSLLRLRRAEQTVRDAATEWQATFDALGDGVALFDREGRITRQNRAFGVFRSADRAIEECFHLLRRESKRQLCEAATGERTFSITMDPVHDAGGELSGAVCVVCDISEKKRFEAKLEQTARLESIGVLAGGIAHDFNNLLTGILGNANLLLDTMPPDSNDRELALEIVKASESAADLTRQILAYAGKARFVFSEVNLSKLAEDSRVFVRRFTPPGIQLVYDTAPDLPHIRGDASQMQQVLMNLIINAAESFAEGQTGAVQITTRRERLDSSFFNAEESGAAGEYVVLEVKDTGSGMDEATRSRIFDPFFTTKFTGRGLGLSAVHGILNAHGGILRLHTKVGAGTCFRLYFPAAPHEEPLPVEKKAEPLPLAHGNATVLVVDDETVVRKFATVALEKLGYCVLSAQDGSEAVQIVRERGQEIAVIVLDYTMPVMGGEEAFRRIHEMAPGIPVILSSGFSAAVAQERFDGNGLAGFLAKPFTAANLGDAIRDVLRPA